MLITLMKNLSDDENRFKRINVSKLILIKDLYNKPVRDIEININDVSNISKLNHLEIEGSTNVKLKISTDKGKLIFNLKKNRKIDRNSINLLKKAGFSTQIN